MIGTWTGSAVISVPLPPDAPKPFPSVRVTIDMIGFIKEKELER
jgi:hypothetical protein